MKTKEVGFTATGGFNIPKIATELLACNGDIVAFRLPNGMTVRLCIALEVESKKGNYTYITSEGQMADIGFEGLDYGDLKFTS